MPEIIVGIDGTPRGEDALALATLLAETTAATLSLASVFPYSDEHTRASNEAFREALRSEAQALLDQAAATIPASNTTTHAIADVSPAGALHRLAHDLHAALVVIGSSHRGPVGRVLSGTTGDRLLHGSPCPVAIAPKGLAEAEPRAIRTIAVGYDGSEEARGAVAAALAAAHRFGARLRVVGVFDAAQVGTPALMGGGGYMALHKEIEASQREDLDRLVAALPDGVAAEGVFLSGSPGRELVAQSESVDLLFTGSRGYGPVRAVLLGTVSHALVGGAGCPVIVLPRGADGGLDVLFAEAARADA